MANAPKSIRVVEDTTVAGTRHVPAMAAIAEGYGKGERLSLVRDAANPHDRWAVEVHDGADRRIDGGKSVEGRLTGKEQIGSWTRLVMEVVLND